MLENRLPYITFIFMAAVWVFLVFSKQGKACEACTEPQANKDVVISVQQTENANLAKVQVEGMTCNMCVNAVLTQLNQIDGVGKHVTVSLETKSASFELTGKKSLNDIVKVFNELSPQYKLALLD